MYMLYIIYNVHLNKVNEFMVHVVMYMYMYNVCVHLPNLHKSGTSQRRTRWGQPF